MTVKELNLKIDALDEYSTLLYNMLYDMCDESKPLKYPLRNDIYVTIEYMQELESKEVIK